MPAYTRAVFTYVCAAKGLWANPTVESKQIKRSANE